MVNLPTLQTFITEDLESDSDFIYNLWGIFQKYMDEFYELDGNSNELPFETIGAQAHRLRSSCAAFGAEVLNKTLCELEEKATEKNSSVVAKKLIEAQKIARETMPYLKGKIDDLLAKEKDCA